MIQSKKPNFLLLSGSFLFILSAACSMTNAITRSVASPGDSVEVVEEELAGTGSSDGCFTTGAEFDEYWKNTREKALYWEGKTCDQGNLAVYRNCLQGKVIQEGMCIEEAEMACMAEYAAVEPLFPEAVRISLDPTHADAEDKMGFMGINDLGDVEGVVMYILKDSHLCTIEVEADLRGEVKDDSCTLSGQASLSILYDGAACASVCGSGPNSETPCPVTRSGETSWEATVSRDYASGMWIIQGGAGCSDDNSPGCVGFRGEY